MMNTQQKIWKGSGVFLWSVRPILAYIFLPGILMYIGKMIRHYPGSTAEFSIESGNFYNFLGFVLILVYFYKSSKKRGESFFDDITLSWPKEKKSIQLLALCLVFGAAASLFVSSFLTVVPLPFGLSEAYGNTSSALFAGKDILLLIFSMVLFAPISEEILFRGYMLNRLLTFFPERTAIWICSVTFALCHVDPLWVIYALCIGLFLSWISVKWDNVLFSISIHMGFNSTPVILFLLDKAGVSQFLFGNKFLVVMYGLIGILTGRLIYTQMIKEK